MCNDICNYDSLFVKEVIRTYCGDSSVGEPIKPPVPETPPVPPIVEDDCVPTEIHFEYPIMEYRLKQALALSEYHLSNAMAILSTDIPEEQLSGIATGCNYSILGLYSSLSEQADIRTLISWDMFGGNGGYGSKVHRNAEWYLPEKTMNNIAISSRFDSLSLTNYTIERDDKEITYEVGDVTDITELVMTEFPQIAQKMLQKNQEYLATYFNLEPISLGNLISGTSQRVDGFYGINDIADNYREHFGGYNYVHVSGGFALLLDESHVVDGSMVSTDLHGSGYAAYSKKYFYNWMTYREPYDTVLSEIGLENVLNIPFRIHKKLTIESLNPKYSYLNEVVWEDSGASFEVSNIERA